MGRHPLGDTPMTAAQRKQRQRDKMKAAGIKTVNVTLTTYTQDQINRYCEISGVPESVHIATIASGALMRWAENVEKRWAEIEATMASLKAVKPNA